MSELVAKTVFGEMTLGEVFQKFEGRVSSITVILDRGMDSEYTSWIFDAGTVSFVGEWEVEYEFPLNTKVKVREDFLEFEYKSETYTITLTESKNIRFDALLP